MLNGNTKQSYLAVILVGAFASGCVSRPVYHDSWAEQVEVESDACPVIDGEYQNAGEAFSQGWLEGVKRHEMSLAHLVNGGYGYGSHQADDRLGTTFYDAAKSTYQTVSLRLVGDKLHIEASRADGSIRTFELPTHQRCRNSTLLVETDWWLSPFMVARLGYAIGRAEDGSLLAYGTSSGAGVFVGGGTGAIWIRFPPVAPLPAGAESPRPDPHGMGIPDSRPALTP
jgi:hypothetical protein